MAAVIVSAGWPLPASSAALSSYVARVLRGSGVLTRTVMVSDLPARDLVNGRLDSKPIAQAFELVHAAHGVVVTAAAYPEAEACLISVLLSLLRPKALAKKAVLPIAVGHCPLHAQAAGSALREALTELGASSLLPTLHVDDAQITHSLNGEAELDVDVALRLHHSARSFIYEMDMTREAAFARHPRQARSFIHALPLAGA